MKKNNPPWLEDVLEAILLTDGVDDCQQQADKDGTITITIKYGEEILSFRAGSDGDHHGAQYDGGVHEMGSSEQVQYWCAGELYARLQKSRSESAETLRLIQAFCKESAWADDGWKQQSHIKPFFDLHGLHAQNI